MGFNLPFFQTGTPGVDQALFQLVEKLNATEFGAYAVFKEAENAINAEKIPKAGAADTAKSPLTGYAAIRDLIVKTGDYAIKNSETIEKTLSGSYETDSPFGRYLLQTNQRITANSTGVEQLFTYTEGINNDDGEYGTLSTKQYIKTGLLFYDENVPKYGVGIGIIETTQEQGGEVIDRDTSKLLTMTADEIGFWQQATKVAYIQSGALYLPNAHITGGSIAIGPNASNPNFEVDDDGEFQLHSHDSDGAMQIRSDSNSIIMQNPSGTTTYLTPRGLAIKDAQGGFILQAAEPGGAFKKLVITSDADVTDGMLCDFTPGYSIIRDTRVTGKDFLCQTTGSASIFYVDEGGSETKNLIKLQARSADGTIRPLLAMDNGTGDAPKVVIECDSNNDRIFYADKIALGGYLRSSWPQGLPSVTSQYNGYTLVVAGGAWAMTPLPTGGLHGFYVYGDPSGYGHYSGIFIPQNTATGKTWQIADETYSISFKLTSSGSPQNVTKWQGTTEVGQASVTVLEY